MSGAKSNDLLSDIRDTRFPHQSGRLLRASMSDCVSLFASVRYLFAYPELMLRTKGLA